MTLPATMLNSPDQPAQSHVPSTPGQAEAERLLALYLESQLSLLKVLAIGMYCYDIKSRLPHGQFQKWCQTYVPDISYRSLRAYMQLSSNVFEAVGVQIGSVLPLCRGGNIFLVPDDDLDRPALELKAKILPIIQGKTQRQLFCEFKTAKELPDGTLTPCNGAGQYHGRSVSRAESDHLRAVEMARLHAGDWIALASVLIPELPLLDRQMLENMLAAGIELNNRIRRLLKDPDPQSDN